MARVTLYEYDGETRHESGVSITWTQVGEPVEFDRREMNFEEALADAFPPERVKWFSEWQAFGRSVRSKRIKVYEAETDDRPLYRAEVEE